MEPQAIARGSIGMTDPAVSFEPHRRRLLGLAYRMLGSVSEAEDEDLVPINGLPGLIVYAPVRASTWSR